MTDAADEKKQSILAAIASLRAEVEQASVIGESLMTLPDATVDALTNAGLFKVKLPEALGGLELDLVSQYEIIEAMSYVDAAAGWCLMIGATSIAMLGAFLPEAALADVFPGGHVPRAAFCAAPTGSASTTYGGFTLSGRWSFASGVRHSAWVGLSALVPSGQPDSPQVQVFAVPTSEARLHHNWDTIGMRGTGSCDVSLDAVFVPAVHTLDPYRGEPVRGGPLYRLGVPAFVAYEHAAFAIGIARRAIDTIVELAPAKLRGLPPRALVHRESFQRDIGELDLRLRAARALVLDRNREAWRVVTEGSRPDPRLQKEFHCVAAFATDVALDVVTRVYRYAGGAAVYKPNLLERSVRDLHTATQHVVVSNIAYENHGRQVLGVEEPGPPA